MTLRGFTSWFMTFITTFLLCGLVLIGQTIWFGINAETFSSFLSGALWVMLFYPLMWGLLMFYTYWDQHKTRPLWILSSISLVSVGLTAAWWMQ